VPRVVQDLLVVGPVEFIRQFEAQLAGPAGPAQFADLIERWTTEGACDGFTLQPTTLPGSLEDFTDHVVPILQQRGLHRTEYTATTLRGHLGVL
jgi:alkanesulfonate monooxygenase SsuD/methylene tetrahydromethanopterin reductase-like flavin-dependent oxidoreductase (luciferase family)